VGDAFRFDKCRSKNLVPHRQPRERRTNIKGEAFQLSQVHAQYRITNGCDNTPYDGKEYYHDRLCSAITHELFYNINKSLSEASTPTCGGDAFGMELAKCHMFSLSGLNLTFEGLLLGVSLRILMEGTHNDPHKSSFRIRNTLAHVEGMPAMFARSRRCPGSPSGGCGGPMARRLA
jgi:hypothetical protein